MSEIIGVSFPLPKWSIDRFFDNEKTVFIKPGSTFKELKRGQKFIFYQSRKDTGYVGEGIIKSITACDDPLDFFEIFGDKIFLTKIEVRQYIEENKTKWKSTRKRPSRNPPSENRKKRPWIAIEIEKIEKYPSVKKIDGFVPVSGMYIKN